MNLKQYLRVVRAHWVIMLAGVVLGVGAAAAYAWTREPVYAAHAQLLVSTRTTTGLSPSQVYQGSLAAESRAASYARVVNSPTLAEAVIDDLDLSRSTAKVQSAITATVLSGTSLIDVKIEDESAQLATDIAEALTDHIPAYVSTLESGSPEASPVEVTVTSAPEVPTSPESPGKGVYLAGGAVVGLILGLAAAVLRELLDRRVRDDEVAEAIAGAPVLSHIPHDSGAKKRPLVVVENADSPEAEAYRRLRTNLRVVTIDRGRRSVLVTSAVAGEGKTLLSANLAFAFAQAGHGVVLVDADMRRPGLARLLGLETSPGLSEVLSGAVPAEAFHREHELPLEVLTSGAPPSNPSELLESNRFGAVLDKLTRRAELVILDSPALLPVSDAAVMARSTAAVLMVARVSSTREEQLDIAAESLRAVGKQPVGAVLNGSSVRTGRAYRYGPSAAAPAPAVPVWDR
jgi:capsular exopolysaccharide synthesis family protein